MADDYAHPDLWEMSILSNEQDPDLRRSFVYTTLVRLREAERSANQATANPAGKVEGYTPQPDAKVALVNEFKADEERLLRKIDAMNEDLVFHFGKASYYPDAIEGGRYDAELLIEARKTLRIAFMLLNRAVFQPQRIKLPEDVPHPETDTSINEGRN